MNWYLFIMALVISFIVFYLLLREEIFELLFSPVGIIFFLILTVILYLLLLKVPWRDLGISLVIATTIIMVLSGLSRWRDWEFDPLQFGIIGILLLTIVIYLVLFYESNSAEIVLLNTSGFI